MRHVDSYSTAEADLAIGAARRSLIKLDWPSTRMRAPDSSSAGRYVLAVVALQFRRSTADKATTCEIFAEGVTKQMYAGVGAKVRTSAEIDANCTIEHEVVGKEAFFSFGDGTVALHFTDERAFRKFMSEAMTVLAMLGLGTSDAAGGNG